MTDPRDQQHFRRLGTARHERYPAALDPTRVKIDERSGADLFEHARECASQTEFVDPETNGAAGTWEPLFNRDSADVLEKRDGTLDAHLALFVAFLNLLDEARAALNAIAKKHLDFYYNDVLRFERRKAEAGKAHVVFELKKNVPEQKLDAGTAMLGPKGLRYELANGLVVYGAAVSRLTAVQREDAGRIRTGDSFAGQAWNPFGGAVLEAEKSTGFAVVSEALRLNEGVREIHVAIALKGEGKLPDELAAFFQGQPLNAAYTGPKDWIDAGYATVTRDGRQVSARIVLDAASAPVVDWQAGIHGGGFEAGAPVLKLMAAKPTPERLRDVEVKGISIGIAVKGVKTLELENDQGWLDPAKPFMPFTAKPEWGTRLYVRCPELRNKPLARFQFNIQWTQSAGVLTFFSATVMAPGVKAEAKFVAKDRASGTVATSLDALPSVLQAHVPSAKPEASGRFFVLSPLTVLPEKTAIDSLTLDYDTQDESPQFFHVGAFGAARRETGGPLFPAYEAAELYVGMTGLSGGENLTLLFGIDEGGDDSENDPVKPKWEMLAGNEWRPAVVESDTTGGLLTDGIVTLAVPGDVDAANTLLPAGCIWFRACVDAFPGALGRVISVDANAAVARYGGGAAGAGLEAVQLPAGSLSKLSVGVPGIRSVKQPYASFGGQAAEDDGSFYARVSERLRHKNRAVAAWDFERLVLSQFQEIQLAKCVPYFGSREKTCSPGWVSVVVLRKLKRDPAEPNFAPRANPDLRNKIKEYVKSRAGMGVEVNVIDPTYLPVLISMGAKLRAGYEAAWYGKELDRAIQRFISPWAFSADEEIRFGGELHWSDVIGFVESLDYVDYVANVTMSVNGGPEVRYATAEGPEAVLVSAAAHAIKVLE